MKRIHFRQHYVLLLELTWCVHCDNLTMYRYQRCYREAFIGQTLQEYSHIIGVLAEYAVGEGRHYSVSRDRATLGDNLMHKKLYFWYFKVDWFCLNIPEETSSRVVFYAFVRAHRRAKGSNLMRTSNLSPLMTNTKHNSRYCVHDIKQHYFRKVAVASRLFHI